MANKYHCNKWASSQENLSSGVCEQQWHPRSLISAFVIRFLKSIICKIATAGEILIFFLVSVAEKSGLNPYGKAVFV